MRLQNILVKWTKPNNNRLLGRDSIYLSGSIATLGIASHEVQYFTQNCLCTRGLQST